MMLNRTRMLYTISGDPADYYDRETDLLDEYAYDTADLDDFDNYCPTCGGGIHEHTLVDDYDGEHYVCNSSTVEPDPDYDYGDDNEPF